MDDCTSTNGAPSPFGPFFSTAGPADAPVRDGDSAVSLDVVAARDDTTPIGTAVAVGLIQYQGGYAKTFRLTVGAVRLSGLWICFGREFVRLIDAYGER
jgi:hypothetical protein